jgi:hypothetical protein
MGDQDAKRYHQGKIQGSAVADGGRWSRVKSQSTHLGEWHRGRGRLPVALGCFGLLLLSNDNVIMPALFTTVEMVAAHANAI